MRAGRNRRRSCIKKSTEHQRPPEWPPPVFDPIVRNRLREGPTSFSGPLTPSTNFQLAQPEIFMFYVHFVCGVEFYLWWVSNFGFSFQMYQFINQSCRSSISSSIVLAYSLFSKEKLFYDLFSGFHKRQNQNHRKWKRPIKVPQCWHQAPMMISCTHETLISSGGFILIKVAEWLLYVQFSQTPCRVEVQERHKNVHFSFTWNWTCVAILPHAASATAFLLVDSLRNEQKWALFDAQQNVFYHGCFCNMTKWNPFVAYNSAAQ